MRRLPLTLGALLALAPTAGAATKTVHLGPPPGPVTTKLQKLGDDPTALFRRTTTIHRGDRITFVNEGFHNVDIPPQGRGPLPLAVPSGALADKRDAAGTPFWFNGRPVLGFNPQLFADSDPATFDGTARVLMALPPLRGTSNRYTVTFTRAGTWTMFCDIHSGMKGKVVVLPKGAKAPSRRDDAKALRRQLADTLAATRRLLKRRLPKRTVELGSAAPVGSEVLAMYPKTLRVKKGAVVRFRMPAASREIHNAAFGKDPTKAGSYLKPLADSLQAPSIDPRASYASDRGLVGLRRTTHGNGFWNSGILDAARRTPFPAAKRIRFDQRGTFVYWCLIHPWMKGRVVVG